MIWSASAFATFVVSGAVHAAKTKGNATIAFFISIFFVILELSLPIPSFEGKGVFVVIISGMVNLNGPLKRCFVPFGEVGMSI